MNNPFFSMDTAYREALNATYQGAGVSTPKADGDYKALVLEARCTLSKKTGDLYQIFQFLFLEGDYKDQTINLLYKIDTNEYRIRHLKSALAVLAPDLQPIDDISVLGEEDFQNKLVDRIVTIRLATNDKKYQNVFIVSFDGMSFTDEAEEENDQLPFDMN